MQETQIRNERRYSDVHFKLSISDGGVPISWDTTTVRRLFMFSEKQRGFGGKCTFQVDDDPHYLNVTFPSYNQQFLGIHRVVAQVEIAGNVATYDARVCNLVASTANVPIVYDEVIDVLIEVSEVDTTVLFEILAACRQATDEATEAAEKADGAFDRMLGGNKNEVLTKLSDNPLDIGWKPSQGGGGSHPYVSLARLRPYLYGVTFDTLPEPADIPPVIGGCSAFVHAGKLYRNLDFKYDDAASFIVRTRDFEGMSFISGLNDGELDDDLIAQLPYRMVDGRNNQGIMVSVHVLFNDWQYTGAGSKTIAMTRLPYEVLTRVKSMDTIAADLSAVLGNLAVTSAMGEYLIQMLVTDGETTYALIPPLADGLSYVLVDATANPKMSNFRYVARAEVSRYDMDLQTRPTGIERFNLMPCDLADLRFTKAYENSDRLSEFIGVDDTTKASSDAELLAIYQLARAEYLGRQRDGKTWQTMHSVVYGRGMEDLFVQEDWADNCAPVSRNYLDEEIARLENEIPDVSELATLTQLQEVADSIPTKVSDLANDSGFQTSAQVASAVGAEASRATGEEARIEALSNKVVLNGMTASEDGSTVKLSLTKINIKTGATSSVDVPLPVVDANGAGVLNPQTYQTIINNQTLINAIIGASVAVSGLAAEPTQAQVTAAWQTASGLEELVNGARVFDVTNTKVWTYYTNTELWYPVEAEGGGSVVIAQWTNSALGTVKGVADNTGHTNDGKLTAETDGTGSVLGWDRLIARVQAIESKEAGWNAKAEVSDIPTALSQLSEDGTHRLVSDTEKTTWSGKQGALSETQMAAVNSGITSAKLTALEQELGNKADKVAVASSIPAGGLLPNTLYNVGTLTGTVTINLATPTDSTIMNIYHICFETGATAPTITWGSAITSWMGGSAPTINANKHYEVDVLNGVAIAMEV